MSTTRLAVVVDSPEQAPPPPPIDDAANNGGGGPPTRGVSFRTPPPPPTDHEEEEEEEEEEEITFEGPNHNMQKQQSLFQDPTIWNNNNNNNRQYVDTIEELQEEEEEEEEKDHYNDYLKSQRNLRDRGRRRRRSRRSTSFDSNVSNGNSSHHSNHQHQHRNTMTMNNCSFHHHHHQHRPSRYHHHHNEPAVVGGMSARNLMGGTTAAAPTTGRRNHVRRRTMAALQHLGAMQQSSSFLSLSPSLQGGSKRFHHHEDDDSFYSEKDHGNTTAFPGGGGDQQQQHDQQHHDHHHGHGHHGGHHHGHHQLMLPFYCVPVQRQLWGDDQVLPHVNWNDLFFDLIFVAACYNLGHMLMSSMNEIYWPRGCLYFVAMFGPIYSIWENDVVYASRYTLVDYAHRFLSVARFVCVSFAVLSIKPIQKLHNPKSAETFVFTLSLWSETIIQLLLNLELYCVGNGDQKAIQNQTKRETLCHIIPSSITYLAATLLSGYYLFLADESNEEDNINKEEEAAAGIMINYTTTESTTTTASDRHHANDEYRFLAKAEGSGTGAGEKEESIDWSIADVPLMLCLGVYVFNILFALYQRSIMHNNNKKSFDIREYYVPNNIEYMIHRYGEWIMLMIGESILSLLIIETVEDDNYYEIVGLGCLTVTVLQMLKFESQPSHADGHALWRSMTAATLYSALIQVISVSLVCFGVSYKLMLKYVVKKNEHVEEESSDSSSSDSNDNNNNAGTDCGTTTTATADAYHNNAAEHRRLAGASEEVVTFLASAWLFCISLTLILVTLELMMATHRGIRASIKLFFQTHGEGTRRRKTFFNWPLLLMTIIKLGILGFTVTLALWVDNPTALAIFGLLIVLTMAVIRIVGWGFEHHEELLKSMTVPTASSIQKMEPINEAEELVPMNKKLDSLERSPAPTTEITNILPLSENSSPITTPQSTTSFSANHRHHHQSALGNINEVAQVDDIVTDESIAKSSRSSQRGHPGDTPGSIWFKLTDPESGDKYYADKAGNTTWEMPLRGKIIRENRPKANPETPEPVEYSKSKKPLPPGWSVHKSTETGEEYFMGPNGETQWHRPKVKKSKKRRNGRKKSKLPKGWIGLIDHESGDIYYYNQKTGLSTWDRPTI